MLDLVKALVLEQVMNMMTFEIDLGLFTEEDWI